MQAEIYGRSTTVNTREGLKSKQARRERCIRMLDSLPRIPAKVRIPRTDAYVEEWLRSSPLQR